MAGTVVDCISGDVQLGAPDDAFIAPNVAAYTSAKNAAQAKHDADVMAVLADKTINPALLRLLGFTPNAVSGSSTA